MPLFLNVFSLFFLNGTFSYGICDQFDLFPVLFKKGIANKNQTIIEGKKKKELKRLKMVKPSKEQFLTYIFSGVVF